MTRPQKSLQSSSKCEFPTPLPEPTAESAIQQLYNNIKERETRLTAELVTLNEQLRLHTGRPHAFGVYDDEDVKKRDEEMRELLSKIHAREMMRDQLGFLWEDVKRIYGPNRCLVAVQNLQEKIGDLPFVA